MSRTFTPEEIGVLRRLIESGVSLSAEKLGQLSGAPWEIVTSSVQDMSAAQVLSLFKSDDTPHYGVRLQSKSLLPAEVMTFFNEASARRLTGAVLAKSPGMRAIPEPEKAVISEISNIIGQAVMKAAANALQVSLVLSVPDLRIGIKSEIFIEAASSPQARQMTAMLLRLDMSSGGMRAECNLVLMLHVDLMRRMLERLTG